MTIKGRIYYDQESVLFASINLIYLVVVFCLGIYVLAKAKY